MAVFFFCLSLISRLFLQSLAQFKLCSSPLGKCQGSPKKVRACLASLHCSSKAYSSSWLCSCSLHGAVELYALSMKRAASHYGIRPPSPVPLFWTRAWQLWTAASAHGCGRSPWAQARPSTLALAWLELEHKLFELELGQYFYLYRLRLEELALLDPHFSGKSLRCRLALPIGKNEPLVQKCELYHKRRWTALARESLALLRLIR